MVSRSVYREAVPSRGCELAFSTSPKTMIELGGTRTNKVFRLLSLTGRHTM
jgi:hypothetical protein